MAGVRLFLLAGVFFCLAGCGTFTRGFSQDFAITTVPPGATVSLSDGQTCVSPCKLTVERVSSLKVKATKAGCRDAVRDVPANYPDGGTTLLSLIDYQTGSAAEHLPNPVAIALSCGPGGTVELDPYNDKSVSLLQSGNNEPNAALTPYEAQTPYEDDIFATKRDQPAAKPLPRP